MYSPHLWGQVKADLTNGNIALSIDTSKSENSFYVEKEVGSDTHLINNINIWLYRDSGANSQLSIHKTLGFANFKTGWNASNDASSVYSTSRPEIRDHLYLHGTDNYNLPLGIQNWPANIDNEQVASYVDVNKNLVYEPNEGDYPFIRGDQCALILENDANQITNSYPTIGLQMAQYAFLFPKSGDPILDNSVGVRWVLKNNSGVDLDTVHFAAHFHAVLSKLNKNFLGTDVPNNAMFAYSQTNPNNYVSICLLNQTIEKTMYFKNENQTANKNDIPENGQHFAYYMQSRWKDGDSLKLGSTGLDGDSVMNFAFPGKTLVGFSEWSEENVGNPAGDRHGLLIGKLTNWKSDSFKVIEMAILYSEGIPNKKLLYNRHSSLKHVYDFNQFTSNISHTLPKVDHIPNPLKKGQLIELNNKFKGYTIYDVSGRRISNSEEISDKLKIPSQVESGIYIIQIEYATGQLAKLKVYIN
jgi:hypothetical protein